MSGSTLPHARTDPPCRCRVSAFSLPFYQPDKAPAALVADACLVQDNKVVVGFMHGPCQASLISLGDQVLVFSIEQSHESVLTWTPGVASSY